MGTLLDEFDREFALKQNEPGFDKEAFKTEFIQSRQLEPVQPKAPTRGIIGDIAASAARSAIGVPQLGLEAIRALDRPGGRDPLRGILTPAIETLEKIKPEISRETGVSGFRRAITGGIEAVLPSLAPIATGFVLGGPVGAGIGAVVGAVGFGASEIDRVRTEGEQHIIDNDLDATQADEFRKLVNIAALKSGGVEAGGELMGNLIVAATAGTLAPFKSALKVPIRETIGALFKQPKKELAVRFGQALAGEEATEFSQAFLQNKFKKDIGLSDINSLNAGLDILGATAVTTLLFFGGAKGINIGHKIRVKNALQDATIDPERRSRAVDEIANVMAEVDGDRERADVFNAVGNIFVQNNQVVSLNATPDQLFEQLQLPSQAERVKIEQERAERVGEEPVIPVPAPVEVGVEPITKPVEPIIKEKDVENIQEELAESATNIGGETAEQTVNRVEEEAIAEGEAAVQAERARAISELKKPQTREEIVKELGERVTESKEPEAVKERKAAQRKGLEESIISRKPKEKKAILKQIKKTQKELIDEGIPEEEAQIEAAKEALGIERISNKEVDSLLAIIEEKKPEVKPVKEDFKSIGERVDNLEVEIDKLEEGTPEFKAIENQIIELETKAAQKAFNGAKGILQEVIGSEGDTGLGASFETILRDFGLSDKPPGSFFFRQIDSKIDNPEFIDNLTKSIAEIQFSKKFPQADFQATFESQFAGITEKGKKNILLEAQGMAQEINDKLKSFLLDVPTVGKAEVVTPKVAKEPAKPKKPKVTPKVPTPTPEITPVIDAQTELTKIEARISPLNARIARGIPKKSEKLKIQAELKALQTRRAELREIIAPTPQSVIIARKNIKAKAGRLGVGVDPTVIKDLAVVGNHHFNRGVRTFLSWSKAMVSDLGTSVRRFLRQIWGSISKGQVKQPIPAEQFTTEEKETIIETPDVDVSSMDATRAVATKKVDEQNRGKPEGEKLFTPPPDPITTEFVPTNVGRPLTPIQQKVFDQNINPTIKGETPARKFDRSLTDLSLKLRTGIVDKYAPISVISPRIGKILAVTSNPVGALLTLFRHGPLKLTKDIFDAKFDKAGKGLKDVIDIVGVEWESFLGWLVANRAHKLLPQGKEKNLKAGEIKEMLKLDEGKMTDGRNRPEVYESARKGLMELNSNVLDIVQEMGLIDKEERKTWEEDFYVPFFRQLSKPDAEVLGPRNITGLVNQDAVKRLKGAPIATADILGNIVLNWSHLLNAAAHNQVGRMTLEQAINEKFTVDQNVAERIIAPEYKVRRTLDGRFEVTDKALKNKGTFDTKSRANEEVESLKDKFIASQKKINDDLIYIREDGKKVWYRVNVPILYKTLVGLHERSDNSKVMKVLRTFKRMLTFSVTFSPEFKIRNLLRDIITTAGVAPVSMNVLGNVIQGTKGTKEGTLSDVRRRAGGGEILFGHTMGTADERLAAMLDRELDISTVVTTPAGAKKLAGQFKKYLQWWNDTGSRLENINRAAIFEQEVNKKSGSFLEANFQARDVLNFERHGSYQAIKFLIDVVPFLNARIQGLDKLGRGFNDPAQRNQLLAVTGMVALASSLLYLTFKDDEDFQEREDWDRDTYWWFKLPGTETAFRIPKPFEIGVFGTIAERMVEQFADDKAHGELFRERLMFALTETFNFNIIPQAFSPALELAVNKNFFTDRPIESKSMQNLSPSQRRNAWTSETAIALSSGFDKVLWDKVVLSPVQIEHLIQGYLGWLGANILGAVDQVFTQPIGGFPGRPAKRIEEFPIIGSFVRTTPARRTRFETIFYEQLNEVNQTYADIRNYRTIGELDKAIALARKNRDKLRFRKLLNNRQRRLSEINKRIRKIRISKTMSASEKKIKIDRQLEIKNRLLKITVGQIT